MSSKAFFLLRLNDHVQYLRRVQATLDGKDDFQGSDFHDCKLGKWLYGEGAAEAQATGAQAKEIFDGLLEPHQRFHEASQQALLSRQQGDAAASHGAVTQMHKLSNTLVDMLLSLDKLSK